MVVFQRTSLKQTVVTWIIDARWGNINSCCVESKFWVLKDVLSSSNTALSLSPNHFQLIPLLGVLLKLLCVLLPLHLSLQVRHVFFFTCFSNHAHYRPELAQYLLLLRWDWHFAFFFVAYFHLALCQLHFWYKEMYLLTPIKSEWSVARRGGSDGAMTPCGSCDPWVDAENRRHWPVDWAPLYKLLYVPGIHFEKQTLKNRLFNFGGKLTSQENPKSLRCWCVY